MHHSTYVLGVVACILVLLAGGCTDLTTTPPGELTDKTYTAGERDIPHLVAHVYAPLREWMEPWAFIGMQSVSGDLFVRFYPWFIFGDGDVVFHRHDWGPFHSFVSRGWSTLYDGVHAANQLIHQVESGSPPVDRSQQAQILAEVRSARAFYYFHLMDNFGSVPLDPVFTTPALPSKSTREVVYDFVVDELTAALPRLPEVTESTYGRFNKWAAKTLLADVYLNAGVYTGTPRWERVVEVTNEVIGSGRYQLADDHKDNFRRENHRSNEIIFAVPYDEKLAPGHSSHIINLPPSIEDAFGVAYPVAGGGRAVPQFAHSYDEGDLRLDDTWIRGILRGPDGDSLTTYVANIPSIPSRSWHYGWPAGKFEIYEGLGLHSDVDFPIYRYADVLLMKAEALLRMDRASEAATLVTQVRERSFEEPLEAAVTGAELRQGSTIDYGHWEDGQVVEPEGGADVRYGRFLDELGWEFTLEGHRRQDLIRFETESGESVFTAKSWFEKRASASRPCETIFPIPEPALEENPELRQHECYQ